MQGFRTVVCMVSLGLLTLEAHAHEACPVTHRVHDVQGNAATQSSGTPHDDRSPLSGQTVTIEGVVVADFQSIPQSTRELRGFFLQEEDGDIDADPTTSEGLFVFTGSGTGLPRIDVQEGQRVCVTGPVSEFFGMTQLTATAAASLLITATTAPLPSPAVLSLPVVGDLDDYYERFEGMRVHVVQPLYVAEYFELARYGHIVLTSGGRPYQYTHDDFTPTAAEYAAFQEELRRRRIIVDDPDNTQNAPLPAGRLFYPQAVGFGIGVQGTNFFRGGDVVADLTGVLHWSFAGQTGTDAWRIRPTLATPITFTPANPRPAPPLLDGNVRVASFNVLNYFSTIDTTSSTTTGPCGPSGTLDCRGADSIAEFNRQNEKLTAALAAIDADVFGLIEIENNGNAAVLAIAELANRLNARLGTSTYAFVPTGVAGTDAITVGLLYKPGVVRPRGAPAILSSPEFVDPNATGQQRNRPAIAQTFEVVSASNADRGAVFTVVVNHLKSKGADSASGADVDQLDGQSAWNDTRARAASYLANTWLPTDPTGQGDSDVLIIGDLNAYRGEAPVTALREAGYIDLHDTFEGDDAYSYLFDGQLGYLDHALANASLAAQVASLASWKINADEVPVFDYNDTVATTGEASFEAEPTGNSLYEPNAFRTSDHDPVIVGLDLTAPLFGDVDRDGDIDRLDITLITRALNQAANGPTDVRDLNADGLINIADARLAALRCTRTHCVPG